MKKIFVIIIGLLLFCSCKKDFLDREPLSELSPNSSFNSESELKLYINSFYAILPQSTDIYGETQDNIILNTLDPTLTGNRTIPVSGGGWSWAPLRNINYFLQHYKTGNLPDNVTSPYVGAARFFRAYFYFNLVTQFGDVPWYSNSIEANDSSSLNRPRDSRMLVIDSVIADLNYAIANLPTTKSADQVTKWTALAFKSRICLFEGTYRKYHASDVFGKDSKGNLLTGATELLQQSVAASDSLMNSKQYSIYKSTPDKAYQELFVSSTPITNEIILARTFDAGLLIYHNVNYYTLTPSFGKPGLAKQLVNSYLMKNGSSFTNIPNYQTISFYNETQNRDPRLSQTIRTPGYMRIGSVTKLTPSFGSSTTGYQLIKYVSDATHDKINGSVVPMPVFRYAEVLLNYAEAKAELGTLSRGDIDVSIKLLRDRVGMPNLDMDVANANPDPYLSAQYVNVTGINRGVILEIRRERRIELVMEGFRLNDLMRWKEGHLLANPYLGMFFPGPGSFDLDGDGNIDLVIYTGTKPSPLSGVQYLKLSSEIELQNGVNGGNVIVNGNLPKTFNENRDYIYPIPTQELLLNHNLIQNPGW